jgi:hypothetical protein
VDEVKHLEHPDGFKDGTRVLYRVGRRKDTENIRKPIHICTRNLNEFENALRDLRADMVEGERIYASTDSRNEYIAVMLMKERMLANDYQNDKELYAFYFDLDNKWQSCLMSPRARMTKFFLFDVDDDTSDTYLMHDLLRISGKLKEHAPKVIHGYFTKNGRHYITTPFNPSLLSKEVEAMRKTNSMMLWSY